MRDFTVFIYRKLLNEIKKAEYGLVTFEEYLANPEKKGKIIVLRHDVDKRPLRAFAMAELENGLGIKGTYYFRVQRNEITGEVIGKIAGLGHEIGYHYEDLEAAGGNLEGAMASFRKNLTRLRAIVPIKTICMHGSPMSKNDNRELWKSCSYREFGILGEPYFDIDFDEVLYLTDTGRRWDGWRVSIRDKVRGDREEVRGERLGIRGEKAEAGNQKTKGREEVKDSKQKKDDKRNEMNRQPRLHSTHDIINALRNKHLPDQIMLTIHPQRWTDEWLPWIGELVSQNIKNRVKYFIAKIVVSNE